MVIIIYCTWWSLYLSLSTIHKKSSIKRYWLKTKNQSFELILSASTTTKKIILLNCISNEINKKNNNNISSSKKMNGLQFVDFFFVAHFDLNLPKNQKKSISDFVIFFWFILLCVPSCVLLCVEKKCTNLDVTKWLFQNNNKKKYISSQENKKKKI